MSNDFPKKWQPFLDNLQLQHRVVQAAFEYGLAVLLAEAGELTVVGRDAAGAPALFRAADGQEFSRTSTGNPAQEQMVQDHLRSVLGWEA